MVLVDTSVWVEHFRRSHSQLSEWLSEGVVLIHPFVIGELACGNLRDRSGILDALRQLPEASVASNEEVSALLEQRRLYGQGLGWVDLHMITSALLTRCSLATLDKALARAGAEAGIC